MGPPAEADIDPETLLRQQQVVTEVGQRSLEADNLDRFLLDGIVAVVDAMNLDYGGLFVVGPQGDRAVLREGVGWTRGSLGTATVELEEDALLAQALSSGEPASIEDLSSQAKRSSALIDRHGVESGLAVVLGPRSDPEAVLAVYTDHRRRFAASDGRFLQSIANVLASTIQRERAERRAADEQSLTERVVETSPVGIMVLDPSGELLYVNEHAESILGRGREEMATFTYDDPRWSVTGPGGEVLDPDEMPFSRVMEAGEPVYDMEVGFQRPEGGRIWVKMNGAPLQTGDSQMGAIFTLMDVSEHRQLQTEFEEMLGRVTDAFYALDRDFRFTHVNDSAAQFLQRSEEELLGENLWELYPEAAEIDEVWDAFHRALDEQETTGYQVFYPPLDLWVDATIYPSETGVSVYFRDISERKRREQALRESEAKFRTLAENLAEIVWMTSADPMDFLYMNPAYEEVFELERARIYEKPLAFLERVHPEDRQRVRKAYTALPDQAYDEEYRVLQPSGEIRWLHAKAVSVENEAGDTVRIVGIAEDITDRKQHERELEESRQRYRTLVENFPNGAVALVDEQLRYQMVGGTPVEDVDASVEEMTGRQVAEVAPPALAEQLVTSYEEAFEGIATTFEHETEDRSFQFHILPVQDEQGEIFAAMGMSQDITEQKERERRLQESNERLEQFAYAASHDLQEPLRMVSTYLQLIEQRYGHALDEEGREFFAYATDGAQRMREMIKSLLEYSRVTTQGRPLEATDASAVLDDVLSDLSVQIEETDAQITVGSLPVVHADPVQLGQVFRNLLSNALKYSGDQSPRVHVDAEPTRGMWRFSVADEGVGIDPNHTDRIFEVFQRLDSHNDDPGTGVGLAICKQILDRHGGQIWAESEPGEGSVFFFTLPFADNQPEADPSDPAADR